VIIMKWSGVPLECFRIDLILRASVFRIVGISSLFSGGFLDFQTLIFTRNFAIRSGKGIVFRAILYWEYIIFKKYKLYLVSYNLTSV
jgi:hypothetical protein